MSRFRSAKRSKELKRAAKQKAKEARKKERRKEAAERGPDDDIDWSQAVGMTPVEADSDGLDLDEGAEEEASESSHREEGVERNEDVPL